MAETPETPAATSADEIEKGRRRQKKSDEERLSFLEDENESLRGTNSELEKQLKAISKTMKVPESQSGNMDFWKGLADELGL